MPALLECRRNLLQEYVELLRLNGHHEDVATGDGRNVVRAGHEACFSQVVEPLRLTPRDPDVGRGTTTGPDPSEG